jgi:predicted DNA binding CopG/RHH family protein
MRSTKAKAEAPDLEVPDFAREAEEARWWAGHQDAIATAFEKAASPGRLARGTALRKGSTPTTTIRLDPEDLSRARRQAERRGLPYQT